MITLIIGGSGSGKSAYAESLFDHFTGKKYYLATMQVYDAEAQRKVDRHRRNRAGKGFQTVEQPTDIGKLQLERKTACAYACGLLLECMSNLVANEMFQGGMQLGAEAVADKVAAETVRLAGEFDEFVVVTNQVFEDGIDYGESTMAYLRALGLVNCRLAAQADRVVEVVAGIPVVIKE